MLDYEIREDGKACFKINKQLYPLKAVYRAMYLLTDKYYIGMDQNEEEYLIFFSGKEKKITSNDVGEFQNELLNQCMKFAIKEDTKQIRELIVTRALYSAFVPQEDELTEKEEGTYCLDEIAEAWNES